MHRKWAWLGLALMGGWGCTQVTSDPPPQDPLEQPPTVSPNDPDIEPDAVEDDNLPPPDFTPTLPPQPSTGAGPWPEKPLTNVTAEYKLGRVQSVGVDAAYNLWLLDGARIGVVRPGDTAPTWVSNLGQASKGFEMGGLALGSTVICGGAAGRAYVGYHTYSVPDSHYESPSDPEFQKGDLDVVRLDANGGIVLETHLGDTTDTSGYKNLGLRNTNDWHYDEDRSVFSCTRVMRGKFKDEVYIGTNHGVTRIRGLVYNSHRHPVWDVDGSLRIGYNYGLGIAQNGDLLIANEWKLGVLTPPENLADYDDTVKVPYKLNTHGIGVTSLEEMDFWRGFQQTTDGKFYVGSEKYGLYELQPISKSNAQFTRVASLPSSTVRALAAADDGSLLIATASGLFRMDSTKTVARVPQIPPGNVKALIYDPSVTPSMLWVHTDRALYLLRGY